MTFPARACPRRVVAGYVGPGQCAIGHGHPRIQKHPVEAKALEGWHVRVCVLQLLHHILWPSIACARVCPPPTPYRPPLPNVSRHGEAWQWCWSGDLELCRSPSVGALHGATSLDGSGANPLRAHVAGLTLAEHSQATRHVPAASRRPLVAHSLRRP